MVENISSGIILRSNQNGDTNYLNNSWMYQLRTNNKTKKRYEVDPFVEVYQFRDNFYGLLSDNLDNENGFVWMYLIVGPEKALLVDTSFGLGNLKGLVNEISGGKEVIVVNTHCSCDHSYGNSQFERTYGHKDLADDMEWKQDPHIWDYLFDEKTGKSIWCNFNREDLVKFKRYEYVGVEDGHIFDLGEGYEVELVWLPGHQPGHAGYLDKQNRILIAGDAVCGGGVSLSGGSDFYSDAKHAKDKFQGSTIPSEDYRRTVSAYREGLLRVATKMDKFDYIFGGHDAGDLNKNVIYSIIDACDEIIADPGCYDMKNGDRCSKSVKGWGYIWYYEKGI